MKEKERAPLSTVRTLSVEPKQVRRELPKDLYSAVVADMAADIAAVKAPRGKYDHARVEAEIMRKWADSPISDRIAGMFLDAYLHASWYLSRRRAVGKYKRVLRSPGTKSGRLAELLDARFPPAPFRLNPHRARQESVTH